LVIKDTLSKIRAQGGETMDLTLDVDAMLAWTTVDTFPLMLFKDGKRIQEEEFFCVVTAVALPVLVSGRRTGLYLG
jgi:hypothetical protein